LRRLKAKEGNPNASRDFELRISAVRLRYFARTFIEMEPYAKPKEKKVGAQRPKISHLPSAVETRTRQERQAEKQAVAAERRAIKKSARRHLKQELLEELEETD
jgi:hypothetical protein